MSHVRTTSNGSGPAPDTETTAGPTSGPTTEPTTELLAHEVEAQREELAATVHALSHKLDVKTQAGLKAEQAMDRVTTADGRPRPELLAGAVGLLAAAVALVWWRRNR
jgi:hypothetical protein